jgi:hypothetical protein
MCPAPALPKIPHVPGSGTTPDRDLLALLKGDVPARVTDANWREVAAYRNGLALYRAGYFWEAHEVWEPVWMAAAPGSRVRSLLQGLIQLTNACLKVAMGRPRAARRLLDLAEGHVREAVGGRGGGVLLGLEPASVAEDIRRFRGDIGDNAEAAVLRCRPCLESAMRIEDDGTSSR